MKKYSSAPDASLAGINECFCFHLFKELKLHLYFIECICMFPKPTAWFLQNSGSFDWVTAVLFFSQGEKKGMKWNPQETAVDRTKWTSYSLTQKRERKIIILLCYLPACVAWARTQINQSAYPGMFSYLLWGQIMEMKKQTVNPTFLSWELSDEAATADNEVSDFQEETVHTASGACIAHYQQNNPPSP